MLDMDRPGQLLTTGVTILLDATELARAAATGTQTDRDRLRRLAPRRPLQRTTSRRSSGRGLEQANQTRSPVNSPCPPQRTPRPRAGRHIKAGSRRLLTRQEAPALTTPPPRPTARSACRGQAPHRRGGALPNSGRAPPRRPILATTRGKATGLGSDETTDLEPSLRHVVPGQFIQDPRGTSGLHGIAGPRPAFQHVGPRSHHVLDSPGLVAAEFTRDRGSCASLV